VSNEQASGPALPPPRFFERETTHVMYVDESWWSGPEIEDHAQPMVFFGGLIVPVHRTDELNARVDALIEEFKGLDAKEVKGKDLFKRGGKKNKRLAHALLKAACDVGATFVSTGVHKLMQATAMIVAMIHDGQLQPLVRHTVLDAALDMVHDLGQRPNHWIAPPELSNAYFAKLNNEAGHKALSMWVRSVWPDPETGVGNPGNVDQAIQELIAAFDAGTTDGLTLRELLTHRDITAEQADQACREMRQRLGGDEPLVSDILRAYDTTADLVENSKIFEPGMIAFTGILQAAWMLMLWQGSRQAPAVDPSEQARIDIIQDEPSRADYKPVYRFWTSGIRRTMALEWLGSHEFAVSDVTPGLILTDVWTNLSRLLVHDVLNGRPHERESFARLMVRPDTSLITLVASPSEMDKWRRYVERHHASE
jgi:hypothetical protein